MKKTIKETVREAIQVLASNGDAVDIIDLEDVTGLPRQTLYANINKLKKAGMVEKFQFAVGYYHKYRYIGPQIDNVGVLETNQEGFSLPLVKRSLTSMSLNTAVHVGWKTHDGQVFCLCGANEVARKSAKEGNFDPEDWHEVPPEKYKNVTCKKCISAWYANKTREGDTLSAQDYVREKIRRDHIEKTNRGESSPSTPSDPIPLDDNMKDEPMMKTKKRTVTIRFDDMEEPETKKVNDTTKKDLGDGVIFNTQIKMVKLKHLPDGEKPAAYKCRFCCFNGLRPCPKASLNEGEKRFLCYEAGTEYYFIEVLSKQG